MIKNRVITLVFFLISTCSAMFSQNEASKWYFGEYAELDFMTSPPTSGINSAMLTQEGCASIANGAGTLLFYTDGITVWNSSHNVMANGTGLLGNGSSTQSGVIIKQPGSQNLYIVFTVDAFGGSNGLRYSVVDMSLASGSGSVITKNVLLHTPSTEKITAVLHCNGIDVWVVTHDVSSNMFRTFLVTAAGVNTTAVLSAAGPVHTNELGYMKASGNGRMLAACVYTANSVELYDFNISNGMVSNPIVLGTNFYLPYGCEFSPDCKVFYACDAQITSMTNIYQWDLCAGSPSAIIASQYIVRSASTNVLSSSAAMQLAPDGKIYISRYFEGFFSVINNPNVPGPGCNYVDTSFYFNQGFCRLGLPNFVTSLLKQKPAPFTYTASGCTSVSFTKPIPATCSVASNYYTSHKWIFGDPTSGAANTSTLDNPAHLYSSPGVYAAQLIFYGPCTSDTVRVQIVTPTPTLNVTGNFSVCAGETRTYTAGGANTYTWSGGSTGQTFTVMPANTGTYGVSGTGTNGCASSTVFTVTLLGSPPSLSVNGNFSLCAGEQRTYTVSGANTYTWSDGSNATTFPVTPVNTTTYTVSGTGTNSCASSTVFTVIHLGPAPTLSVIGNTSVCAGEKRNYTASGASTYTWSNGTTGTTFSIMTVSTATYSVSGTGTNSCMSSKVFTVNIKDCTGLEQVTREETGLKIYPNPGHDLIYLETDIAMQVVFYSATGEKMLELFCEPGKQAIDVRRFHDGVYLVKAKSNPGIKTLRFVKTGQ